MKVMLSKNRGLDLCCRRSVG